MITLDKSPRTAYCSRRFSLENHRSLIPSRLLFRKKPRSRRLSLCKRRLLRRLVRYQLFAGSFAPVFPGGLLHAKPVVQPDNLSKKLNLLLRQVFAINKVNADNLNFANMTHCCQVITIKMKPTGDYNDRTRNYQACK